MDGMEDDGLDGDLPPVTVAELAGLAAELRRMVLEAEDEVRAAVSNPCRRLAGAHLAAAAHALDRARESLEEAQPWVWGTVDLEGLERAVQRAIENAGRE